MIKVMVSRQNEVINQISFNGHAGYEVLGKDIVCASASSILITTVNALILFDEFSVSWKQNKNKMIIIINRHNDIVDKLVTNMLNLLVELETQYPKNIKII